MVSQRFIYSLYESRLQKGLPKTELPKHIGLIHDGHRRYARRENLLSYEVSYKIGMVRFKECLSWCDELGIDYVTSWLLSKERENIESVKKKLVEFDINMIIPNVNDSIWGDGNLIKELKDEGYLLCAWGAKSINDVKNMKRINIDGMTVDWPGKASKAIL